MDEQTTYKVFMIEPVNFRLNEQTAVNNYFQNDLSGLSASDLQDHARLEFEKLVEKLKNHGITVQIIPDSNETNTPDSIFPNNWISTHANGWIMLYPMFAENRRMERRNDIIDLLKEHYATEKVFSLTEWEDHDKYLEGTGSLILDRQNKIAYAALSDRTSSEVIEEFCSLLDYTSVMFRAMQTVGNQRLPIYHTNVMMSLGEHHAIVCLDCFDHKDERELIIESLEKTHKEIIEISEEQVKAFAGNTIQLKDEDGKSYIVMSDTAFECFDASQIEAIERHGKIIHSPIPTIEKLGGGSVRCMIAENFLPLK